MIRLLALVACALTVCIAGSSAFIRHWQGGLGCEGWPACYRAASAARDSRPSEAAPLPPPVRAARIVHRASAGTVGVLVLVLLVAAWRSRDRAARAAATIAAAVTAFLGWLGPYSKLGLPLVTLGNLLGGLVLVAALARVASTWRASASARAAPLIPPLALAALVLLAMLAWGGTMIGARHAIDACASAACVAAARFDAAALDPSGVARAVDAATGQGLHVAHRAVALAFSVLALLLAARARRAQPVVALGLVVLVAAQWLAGAATALGAPQPLWTASAHSAIAALLAALLASLRGAPSRGAAQDPGRSRPSSARSA